MKRFVEGTRQQSTLWCWMSAWARTIRCGRSMCLWTGWISPSSALTVFHLWQRGRPAYHPATLCEDGAIELGPKLTGSESRKVLGRLLHGQHDRRNPSAGLPAGVGERRR